MRICRKYTWPISLICLNKYKYPLPKFAEISINVRHVDEQCFSTEKKRRKKKEEFKNIQKNNFNHQNFLFFIYQRKSDLVLEASCRAYNLLKYVLPDMRIDSGERVVQQVDVIVEVDCARKWDALLLSTRQVDPLKPQGEPRRAHSGPLHWIHLIWWLNR